MKSDGRSFYSHIGKDISPLLQDEYGLRLLATAGRAGVGFMMTVMMIMMMMAVIHLLTRSLVHHLTHSLIQLLTVVLLSMLICCIWYVTTVAG